MRHVRARLGDADRLLRDVVASAMSETRPLGAASDSLPVRVRADALVQRINFGLAGVSHVRNCP